MWVGLQCNGSANLAVNHQGEADDKGNARRESGLSLNFANDTLPGEKKDLLTFSRYKRPDSLDLAQHINCEVISKV